MYLIPPSLMCVVEGICAHSEKESFSPYLLSQNTYCLFESILKRAFFTFFAPNLIFEEDALLLCCRNEGNVAHVPIYTNILSVRSEERVKGTIPLDTLRRFVLKGDWEGSGDCILLCVV